MKGIVAYLLAFLTAIISIWSAFKVGALPNWIGDLELLLQCILIGGVGGVIYCLRAVYLNACVRKCWDREWHPWYFIRPFVSLIAGGISWLFLKAGLLVLDAAQPADSSTLGFLALAFIAGYNVDKFMRKLEQISEATWGIEKSRSSEKIQTFIMVTKYVRQIESNQ